MMLEVTQIRKSFGDLEVLKQVDLQVNKGDVVAILGPSGSGKTTLLRTLGEENVSVPAQADVDMSLLTGEAERALLKQIAQFSEVIKLAARDYDPSYINRYLQELAGCFHRFYTACRIRGEEAAVRDARLKLADDTRIVLRNGLKLIGVDAPEKM